MKKLRSNRVARHQQSGITLIEVLISALIMSIALLGMAGLQANSLAQQTAANNRGCISTLVSDIADRLRSNISTTANDSSAFQLTSTWAAQATAPATPGTDCKSTTCTAAVRATYDMTMWRLKLRSELPQGSAYITGNVSDGVQISLMWFDKAFISDNTLRTSSTCTSSLSDGAKTSCCPSAAEVPAGVRCYNVTIIP